jgi:Zinc carboxypeptidase
MHARLLSLALALALLPAAAPGAAAQTRRARTRETPPRPATLTVAEPILFPPPAPRAVVGFEPGEDRKLASWESVVAYFRHLDRASERVRFEELGKTTLGRPFVMATITAPENFARLGEIREIQRQLADPRTLGPGAARKASQLIARGKTIVLITCGIHSTEVGSYLSSMLIAHRLASSDEPEIKKILSETVVLLVPSLNPDGVDIVKDWYDKTLGTPYEGTSPPELYHHYIGHDNNRDWYIFTQAETRLTVDKIHNVWRPQIVHDIHQQGATGARIFVPPYMRPVEPNVPERIVEGYTELGKFMAQELRAAGLKGVTYDSSYDAWTPARAYSHYHGGVRILSETASARIATPVTLRPEDLRAGEGLDPRRESPNFGPVWEGGPWALRDITTYMTTAAFALLRHAADHRERWLTRFYEVGREAVRPRLPGELFAWVIPVTRSVAQEQATEKLLRVLRRGGVEVHDAAPFTAEGVRYPNGAAVIPAAQPYGAFAKALLETQRYPDLRDERGNPQPPYDVTAHTLSLMMGVEAKAVHAPFQYRRLEARFVPADPLRRPPAAGVRLALYRSHVPSMDEGWTRWILEQEGAAFRPLRDAEARAGNLRAKYDVILIPDQSPRALLEGYRRGSMPEELTGGLGEEGVKALREFVEAGGTLVCLNGASEFAAAQLKLPVRNVAAGLRRTEFYIPGSILRVELDTAHPVAAGMPRESIAWFEDSPVFEFDARDSDRVRVVARYPIDRDALLSGWMLGGRKLWGKAALVEVALGRGRIVLFGFRPQYRAQTLATYPLLFNAISLKSN